MHLIVLPSIRRAAFYLTVIPALERICQAFPCLIEEFVNLLVQLAQKNRSRLSARAINREFDSLDAIQSYDTILSADQALTSAMTADPCGSIIGTYSPNTIIAMDWFAFEREVCARLEPEEALSITIHKAFAMLCKVGEVSKVYKEQDFLS